MDNNNLKEELKGLFQDLKLFFTKENEVVTHKFAMNGTLADGTPVMIDGDVPNVGVKVTVQNADGTEAPIADGEYVVKTADSSVQITCVGGLITESEVVNNVEEGNTPDVAGGAGSETNTEQMANEKLADFEKRLSAMEAKLSESNTALESANNEVKEITVKMSAVAKENEELKENAKKLFESVEKIINSPSEKSTHESETVNGNNSSIAVEEFRKRMESYK